MKSINGIKSRADDLLKNVKTDDPVLAFKCLNKFEKELRYFKSYINFQNCKKNKEKKNSKENINNE